MNRKNYVCLEVNYFPDYRYFYGKCISRTSSFRQVGLVTCFGAYRWPVSKNRMCVPVFLIPFAERTIFTSLYCLCSFVKDQLNACGSTSGLSILFHWFICDSLPIQWCLDYCSFNKSLHGVVSVFQLCSLSRFCWLFLVFCFSVSTLK